MAEDVLEKGEKLNTEWLSFLETFKFQFLLNDIPEETIEEMKNYKFVQLHKYMDDLGAGLDELFWRVILDFSIDEEKFSLDAQETEPSWYLYNWENTKCEDSIYNNTLELFTGNISDKILNLFLEEHLNSIYQLNI